MPLLLLILPVAGAHLLENPLIEIAILSLGGTIAFFTTLRGFRKKHGKVLPLILVIVACFIFVFTFTLLPENLEHSFILPGAGFMAIGQFLHLHHNQSCGTSCPHKV